MFPDLRKLERKHAETLVVIGVHSAKFPNEKDSENIRQAILRHHLEHPVVNDADFKIWEAYRPFGVRGWPSFVLIDPEGNVIGYTSGEGRYEILDQAIAKTVERFKDAMNRKKLEFALEKHKAKPSFLSFPGKVLATADRVFIADTNHHRIVVTDTAGKVLEKIGGPEEGRKDGGYGEARFDEPQGMALRGETLYVADRENHLIRAVDLKERRVSTVAGTGERGYRYAQGPPRETALASPWDLARSGDRLFIAMAGAHQIWVLDLAKGTVGPHSGSGREQLTDGAHPDAAFNQPSGLTIGGGKLYVADSEVSGVREVDLGSDGRVRTVLGTGLFDFGDRDGVGDEARLQKVLGVAWHDGMLYVADAYNHKIKVCDPKTRVVKTFLGDGKRGSDDGEAPRFYEPGGLWVQGDLLYVADQNNHAIRVCDLATGSVRTLKLTE